MEAWTGRRIALLTAILWLPLLVIAPTGLYLVDELVQYGAIVAFARDGGFVVGNGWDLYASEDLKWLYLREGPDGLVAQYPFGFSMIAAPFYLLGGMRGVFALNMLGACASVWLTWRIAERLSGREVAAASALILLLATYLANYVAALWPHGVSLGLALAASYGAVVCGTSEKLRPAPAIAGGICLGVGILVRTDVALLLPALGAWMVLQARRPYSHLLLAGAGAALPLLLGAWGNLIKFGVFNPFTYGADGSGGVSLSTHLPTLAGMIAACSLVLLWRHVPGRRRLFLGATAVTLVAAFVLLPELRAAAKTLARGADVLLIDLSRHSAVGTRLGIERDENGIVTFFNMHKKALGQSLPWLGLLPLLVLADRQHRPGITLALLTTIAVVLPFMALSWHGGYAPNMRYFLYAVPFLSYLGGIALVALAERAPPTRPLILRTMLVSLLAFAAVMILAPGLSGHLLEHRLPPLLMAALALLSIVVTVSGRMHRALWVLALLSLTWAFVSAYALDVRQGLSVRAYGEKLGRAYAALVPPGSVVYDNFTQSHWALVERGDAILAVSGTVDGGVDRDFVRKAAQDGRGIVVRDPELFSAVQAALEGLNPQTSVLGTVDDQTLQMFTVAVP